MQTFLPLADFNESARVLDPSRLGNQVYREVLTLLRGGWSNHPASVMWRGHHHALAQYGLAGIRELSRRGRDYPKHKAELEMFAANNPPGMPWWFGNESFHMSHRSNLVAKLPEWYAPLFPCVPPGLPYLWPDAAGNFRTILK